MRAVEQVFRDALAILHAMPRAARLERLNSCYVCGSKPEHRHQGMTQVGARRLRKVGWIFTQSTKAREFIISGEEAAQMAGVQAEMGASAVTAVVSMAPSEDGGSEAHFEAFQVRYPLANCCYRRRFGHCGRGIVCHAALSLAVGWLFVSSQQHLACQRSGAGGRAGVGPGSAAVAGGLVPAAGGAQWRAAPSQSQGTALCPHPAASWPAATPAMSVFS